MSEKKHFLVVGGGIAGLCIVQQLLDRKQKVTLIDRGTNKSSSIAAGLINPLVFRRMAKSWKVDEFLPYAKQFYTQLEQVSGQRFFHPISIRRFFSSEQELGYWIKKQTQEVYKNYMTPLTEEDTIYSDHQTKNDFGTGRVKEAAWVDTNTFLSTLKEQLGSQCEMINAEFDYSKLNPSTGEYNGTQYSQIIFCNGFENTLNPYFQHLPVETTKGEVLTVSSPDLPSNQSINRKCFVLPMGDNQYRVGATYVWNTPEDNVTEEGKKEILDMLKVLGTFQVDVIDHKAGIRPTTPDRRPIIGQHSEFKHLYLFNGLGTKGYLIAPLLSKEFINHLLDGTILDPEVDLKRFLK